jgi:N-acetylmuramoyl-L-alanine amidase
MSRTIHWIVIHCSASSLPAHDNIETITQWHLERGFRTCGYHYFIKSDGTVQIGRNENERGAHVAGHNTASIGICLSGEHKFTDAQFKSLETLLKDICKRHDLEKQDILGHFELDNKKTCPNFDVHKWLSGLNWH